MNAVGLALGILLAPNCAVGGSQHDVHVQVSRVAVDRVLQDAHSVRASVGQDISDAKIESGAVWNLWPKLRNEFPARNRAGDVALKEQNRNEMAIAFGVAAVEVDRALQFLEARS